MKSCQHRAAMFEKAQALFLAGANHRLDVRKHPRSSLGPIHAAIRSRGGHRAARSPAFLSAGTCGLSRNTNSSKRCLASRLQIRWHSLCSGLEDTSSSRRLSTSWHAAAKASGVRSSRRVRTEMAGSNDWPFSWVPQESTETRVVCLVFRS